MSYEYYEAGALIARGELKPEDLQGFRQAMKRFPDGRYTIRVEKAKHKRSQSQNRYWHGVVIPLFSEHCGYELDEMKDALALKLIPREIVDLDTGEVRLVPGHTSELTTGQFNDLIERAQRLGAEMGIYIPDPGEHVRAA